MHFSTDIYECSAFQERANDPESWFLAVTMKPSVPAAASAGGGGGGGAAEQKLPQKTVSYKIYLRPEDRKRFNKKYNEQDRFYAQRIQNLSIFPAAERAQQLREIEAAKGVAHDVWFPAFLSTVTVPPNSELLQLVQNPYFSRVRPKVDANLHPNTPWIFLSPEKRGALVEKVRKAEPDAGIMPHAVADQRLKDTIRSGSGSSFYNFTPTPPDAGGGGGASAAAAAAAADADELTQPQPLEEEKSHEGAGAGTRTRAEEVAARAAAEAAAKAAAAEEEKANAAAEAAACAAPDERASEYGAGGGSTSAIAAAFNRHATGKDEKAVYAARTELRSASADVEYGMAAAAAATPSSSAAKPGNHRLLRRDSSSAKRSLRELHSSPPGAPPGISVDVDTGPQSKRKKTHNERVPEPHPFTMWERRPAMPAADSAAAPGPVPMDQSRRSAS